MQTVHGLRETAIKQLVEVPVSASRVITAARIQTIAQGDF